ncbi:Cycloartenol synthase [Vitis vinifera]|uniref:Cycloartenol synthase n=1 Tax=Vitis vinifera TaxID=29760 RepID=A0A438J4A6_VITVI|nr:Cycloartenol synthase [Vitis vinifera]
MPSWETYLSLSYSSRYCIVGWVRSIIDRRSISVYCTFVGDGLVTWQSKKQSVVARSSAEAEFRAVTYDICEVLWIKQLLEELKAASPLPMKVFCDNKAVIAIAHDPVLHDRTKHVEVDKHFIKEKLENGLIIIPYMPMVEQVADILTKGLPKKQFDDLEDLYYPHPLVQDILWASLHKVLEPILGHWPGNKLREKALCTVMQHVHYEDENTRYICIGPVNKVLNMLCCWIEDPNSEAFKLHIPRIFDYLWIAEDGMKMQVLEDCPRDLKFWYRHISKGGWPFSTADNGWPTSDCTAEGLKVVLLLCKLPLETVGEPLDMEQLFDAVNVVLSLQNADGGFATYELTRSYRWFEVTLINANAILLVSPEVAP